MEKKITLKGPFNLGEAIKKLKDELRADEKMEISIEIEKKVKKCKKGKRVPKLFLPRDYKTWWME